MLILTNSRPYLEGVNGKRMIQNTKSVSIAAPAEAYSKTANNKIMQSIHPKFAHWKLIRRKNKYLIDNLKGINPWTSYSAVIKMLGLVGRSCSFSRSGGYFSALLDIWTYMIRAITTSLCPDFLTSVYGDCRSKLQP